MVLLRTAALTKEKSKKTDNCAKVLCENWCAALYIQGNWLLWSVCANQSTRACIPTSPTSSSACHFPQKAFKSEGARGRSASSPLPIPPHTSSLNCCLRPIGAIVPDMQHNASVKGYWLFLWALLQGWEGKITGSHLERQTRCCWSSATQPNRHPPTTTTSPISFKAYETLEHFSVLATHLFADAHGIYKLQRCVIH